MVSIEGIYARNRVKICHNLFFFFLMASFTQMVLVIYLSNNFNQRELMMPSSPNGKIWCNHSEKRIFLIVLEYSKSWWIILLVQKLRPFFLIWQILPINGVASEKFFFFFSFFFFFFGNFWIFFGFFCFFGILFKVTKVSTKCYQGY